MKVEQTTTFDPVKFTLETPEEVRLMYANLTNPTALLPESARNFSYQLSELIRKNTNVFDRGLK